LKLKILRIPFTFSPIPNTIIDGWLSHLTPHEFVAYACIMRKTWGFKKRRDSIAISQIVEMSGTSRSSIDRALDGLEKKGLIQVSGNVRRPRIYEPLMPRWADFSNVTSDVREGTRNTTSDVTVTSPVTHSIDR
jgi:hypothetical protein